MSDLFCDSKHDGYICVLEAGHAGKHQAGVNVPHLIATTWGEVAPTFTQREVNEQIASAKTVRENEIKTALRILTEGIPGAAFNAVTEDFAWLAEMLAKANREQIAQALYGELKAIRYIAATRNHIFVIEECDKRIAELEAQLNGKRGLDETASSGAEASRLKGSA